MDWMKLILTLRKFDSWAPQQSKGIGWTGLHKPRGMDTTNAELVPFASQMFGCSCVCVLPHIKATGYTEKQRQSTNSLLSLPCRSVLVKDHFSSARTGNNTASASQKIPWFLWEQKNWFGWDRGGAECPHLGIGCHVVQVYPGVLGVRQDLLWWPGSPDFCRRCDLGQ